MTRFGLVLTAIAVVLGATAAALVWGTPEDAIRDALADRIEAMTGRRPIVSGAAHLVMLPRPGFRVEGLTLPAREGETPLLAADVAEGTLALGALVTGRLQLADLTLRRPQFHLYGTGESASWSFDSGALAAINAGRLPSALPIIGLRVIDGVIAYDDRAGHAFALGVPDATLSWPAPDDALSLGGSLIWRDQPLDVALDVADLGRLVTGGTSDITLRVGGALARATMTGSATSDGHVNGDLSISGSSLRQAAHWLAFPTDAGRGDDAFSLKSPLTADVRGFSLPEAEIELSGNAAEGALSLRIDGPRPKISGTLAADMLDASHSVRGLSLTQGPVRSWRGGLIDVDALALFDMDLRLSAAQATVDRTRIEHAALSIVGHDGVYELSLGDATAYGGSLKGRLIVSRQAGKARIAGSLAFAETDVGRALADLFSFRRLEGKGQGMIDLTTSGRTVTEALHNLTGRASMTVANGALVGVDLVDVLRRVERRPLSAAFDARGGRTAFLQANTTLSIEDGIASTKDLRLDDGPLAVSLAGRIGIPGRDLDLLGEARLQNDATKPPFVLPFKVGGGWDGPSVEPDADALIRQSGAAAPLFRLGGKAAQDSALPVRAFTDPAATP